MDYKKDLLLASAARLYSIGLDLEAARAKLKDLVALGVSYDSVEMAQACQAFQSLEQHWRALERQHLELRNEIKRTEQA